MSTPYRCFVCWEPSERPHHTIEYGWCAGLKREIPTAWYRLNFTPCGCQVRFRANTTQALGVNILLDYMEGVEPPMPTLCDVCGAPATTFVQTVYEDRGDPTWITQTPSGIVTGYCSHHVPEQPEVIDITSIYSHP
jgi:hypothetical protein